MSWWITILVALVVIAALGWVFRFVGQWATGNKPFFRDMPFAVGFGYVLGLSVLGFGTWYYLQPTADDGIQSPGVIFFRWAVQGFVGFALVAYFFRALGRAFGSDETRKVFRSMPLTASFGIVVILAYAFVSIFAGQIPLSLVISIAIVGVVVSELARRLSGDQAAGTIGTGFAIALLIVIIMYFVGPLAPYGQEEIFEMANVVPGGNPALGGDPKFPLGTDQIGRDIYSRLMFGAQNTVGIAFATTCLAFFLGGTLGFLAAIVGGWTDQILSRIVDVLMSIPSLIFALLLMTIASAWASSQVQFNLIGFVEYVGITAPEYLDLSFTLPSLTVFMIFIIATIDATRVYRLARAVGQNIVVMDYIEAAKLRGERMGYLIFKEILPNATAPLLAEFGLRFCFVFLTIASLSFLGVGIQPPLADWGTMVKDLSQFINFAAFAPNVAVAPLLAAGAIALLTVAVNFVVDWMLHKSSGLKE